MRWFGLVLLLSLAACDEPRSAAYSPERGSSFEPVAVELKSAQLAQKIDGIATLVSPDSLALLNAEIRAAEIASSFSQRSLDRYKGTQPSANSASTMPNARPRPTRRKLPCSTAAAQHLGRHRTLPCRRETRPEARRRAEPPARPRSCASTFPARSSAILRTSASPLWAAAVRLSSQQSGPRHPATSRCRAPPSSD